MIVDGVFRAKLRLATTSLPTVALANLQGMMNVLVPFSFLSFAVFFVPSGATSYADYTGPLRTLPRPLFAAPVSRAMHTQVR